MECVAKLQQHERDVAPEIDGAEELLMELLDASLAAEEVPDAWRGKHRQLSFPVDDVGDSWDDLEDSIHPHQEEAGCEDCVLDGIILPGLDGCGCSPAPYVVEDGGGNPVEYWTDQEMEAAAFGPFTDDCVGEWHRRSALEMVREWMYGTDRRFGEFINDVHEFIRVADANKRNDFVFRPCSGYRNQKDYSDSKTLHIHLLKSGFIPSYNCWTKHEERGVIIEDNEEEEEDDNYHGFPEYGDTFMRGC